MTRSQIKKERKTIEAEIKGIEAKLKVAKAKLTALEDQCEHPKMRPYSAMGEIGSYCPDCGYQD